MATDPARTRRSRGRSARSARRRSRFTASSTSRARSRDTHRSSATTRSVTTSRFAARTACSPTSNARLSSLRPALTSANDRARDDDHDRRQPLWRRHDALTRAPTSGRRPQSPADRLARIDDYHVGDPSRSAVSTACSTDRQDDQAATTAGSAIGLSSTSIAVTGDRKPHLHGRSGSPSLGDYHVGDRVKIGCQDGVLDRHPPGTTTTTTTTDPTTTTTPVAYSYATGTLTAFSSSSITVTGDGAPLTCPIGPDAQSLTEFHVGDKVRMYCQNGTFYKLIRTDDDRRRRRRPRSADHDDPTPVVSRTARARSRRSARTESRSPGTPFSRARSVRPRRASPRTTSATRSRCTARAARSTP